MSSSLHYLKPCIKWVGGKRQLMSQLVTRLPADVLDPAWSGTYFEPFIGGGALFFELKSRGLIPRACINDMNAELVNLYEQLKSSRKAMEAELDVLRSKNNPVDFLRIRSWDREESWGSRPAKQRAARFIYLNRTSFNGLWRVNARNEHNVAFANYKKPGFPDTALLRACGTALAQTRISHLDFEEALAGAQAGDFVYLDPPYIPVSATANFDSYTKDGFDRDMCERLARVCADLTVRGVRWLLSNSAAAMALALYGTTGVATDHALVMANRMINSIAAERKNKVQELLSWNYQWDGASIGNCLNISHSMVPCVFQTKLDTHSTANWTLIPRETGQ